jgi:large subunit ribosomal protein L6
MAAPLEIVVKGIDRQLVGQMAATIKAVKPVEPYHGYGIHYKDEVVMRKEGKTAGK